MPLTITATVDPGTHAVTLDVRSGVPDYTVQAAPAGDLDAYTVRARWVRPPGADGSRRMTVDGDVPLNTPTVYVVTDKAGVQAQTAPVTVTATQPVLADATDPGTALDVVVVSQPPNEWQARSVWWDILGGSAPFASVAPMRTRRGDLVLYAATLAQRRELRAVLAPGRPLVLRGTCPDAVDDVTMLVESARDELVNTDRPDGPRLFTITYQALNREQLGPFAVDPTRTYAQVLAEDGPTYRDLLSKYVTYTELLAGEPGASLGTEQWTNGDFAAGGSGWGQFWTVNAAWTFDGSDANAEAATQGAIAMLWQNENAPVQASRRMRITGRVRLVAPGAAAVLWVMGAKAPNLAQPLEPFATVTIVPLVASAVWSTFTADVDVPGPTDNDRVSIYLRCEGMPPAGVVEWDDLSWKWFL